MKMLKGRGIVSGRASGESLVSLEPIHLLGAINSETGVISDDKHQLYGQSITDRVLIFPHSIGSSVGAYVIFKLKRLQKAPVAIVTSKADIILVSGCAMANIPTIDLPETPLQLIPTGVKVTVDGSTGIISWNSD